MSALMNYRWPGNVRELEHAVERAVILANAASIRVRDLPPEVTQKSRARARATTPSICRNRSAPRSSARSSGSAAIGGKAAEALKISTVTLWRKMKQYGLSI